MNSKAAERRRTISYFEDKLLIEVTTSTWLTSTVHDIYEILGASPVVWQLCLQVVREIISATWVQKSFTHETECKCNTQTSDASIRKMCVWTHYSAACCIVKYSVCWLDVIPAVRSKQKGCELQGRSENISNLNLETASNWLRVCLLTLLFRNNGLNTLDKNNSDDSHS